MSDDVLTMDKIRQAMRLLDEGPRVPRFQFLPVVGGYMEPVRRHSRHANGGKAAYHRRVQKKWIRRYGERWHETQKRGEVYILGGTTVLVRQEDFPAVIRAMASA